MKTNLVNKKLRPIFLYFPPNSQIATAAMNMHPNSMKTYLPVDSLKHFCRFRIHIPCVRIIAGTRTTTTTTQ